MAFNADHTVRFGLKVTSRSVQDAKVTACVCQFCEVFGRENSEQHAVTKKRKKTERIKYFQTFRTDIYTQHLIKEHPQKWTAYQQLATDSDKEAFFAQVPTPFIATLVAHFGSVSHLVFAVNSALVDVVIGTLLFHPDNENGVSHQLTLALFRPSDGGNGGYCMTIKTPKRFWMVVKVVATGASF